MTGINPARRLNLRHVVASALLLASTSLAEFSTCHFNFGKGFTGKNDNYANMDHITIWVGGDATFNNYWQGDMLRKAVEVNATPVFYGYVIGELGHRSGLSDCDVSGGSNLCTAGSNLIRQKKAAILSIYEEYSSKSAAILGANSRIIWLIEPDFYQYSVMGGSQQAGGGIPNADMGTLFKDIVNAIRKHMPKAEISIDISPWISNPSSWYSNFDLNLVQYAHTSGGRTEADNAKIRVANSMTWSAISTLLKKPVIADDGYGVGGATTGHDYSWDQQSNLTARMADGVIAISQQAAASGYNSTVASLHTKMGTPSWCGTNPPPSSSSKPSSSSVSSSSSKPSSSSSKPSSSSSIPPSSSSSSSNQTGISSVSQAGNLLQNGNFASGSNSWELVVESSTGAGATGSVVNNTYQIAQSWGGENLTDLILEQSVNLNMGATYTLAVAASSKQYEPTRDFSFRLINSNDQEVCKADNKSVTETVQTFTCSGTNTVAGSGKVQILSGGAIWQDLVVNSVVLTSAGGTPILGNQNRTQWLGLHFARQAQYIPVHNAQRLDIYNTLGHRVQSLQLNGSGDVQIQDLPAGVWMLRLTDALGAQSLRIVNRE